MPALNEWDRTIEKLNGWLDDPAALEHECETTPKPEVIVLAIEHARKAMAEGWESPDRIVCEINGGIVFEWGAAGVRKVLHVWDDSQVEYIEFDGELRIVERRFVD